MSGHARLSPSAAERWMNCPGSVRECDKYPESRSSPAAIDGTHTHTVLEHCLKNNVEDCLKLNGIKMSDDDGEFRLDLDRLWRVEKALKYIRDRAEELGVDNIMSEHKVNCGMLIERDDMRGTLDVRLMNDEVLEIIDYKDGMGVVEAEQNKQLMLYALGELGMQRTANGWSFKKIIITIIQPKMERRGRPIVSSWEISVDDLLVFGEEVKKAADATDLPDAPLIPGDSQCKWCEHKGNCNPLVTEKLDKVGIMFEDITQQSSNTEPTDLTDDQIKEIVESAPSVRAMLEAVEKEALRRMESGHSVSGLKVVRTSGRRQWGIEPEDVENKLRKMGVPKDAVYIKKIVSPTQAEKLSWVTRSGESKTLSKRQLSTLNKEYVVKTSGSFKVVPEDEKGEAVTFDASPMFDNVQDDVPAWLK